MIKRYLWLTLLLTPLTVWGIGGRPADAKVYAYLITEDRTVIKLDTDTDSIVPTRMLPPVPMVGSGNWEAYVSGVDNLLLLSYYTSQTRGDVNDFHIAALDLRGLTLKKDLGQVWKDRPDVLIPPKAPHFFVVWFDPAANNGQGARRVTRYDKATLTSLGELPQIPDLFGYEIFSPDGSRLYSYPASGWDGMAPIRIFDPQDLRLLSLVEVSPLLDPKGFGALIDDLEGDRALIVQGMKPMGVDPIHITLFSVRLPDGVPSARISTGMDGKGLLTPDGTKILLNEQTVVRAPGGSIKEIRTVGRLHVYDVTSGSKLGQITVPIRDGGEIWAIHPRGDKVYYRLLPAGDQGYTVMVISLTSFSVVKQLQLPVGALFFVEETP